MNCIYLTATLDAATWGAELAVGDGCGRIYIVEPTGGVEDDPNVTDKKFPGNPAPPFRSLEPIRVVGELLDWGGHPPAAVNTMRERVADAMSRGTSAIDD
jgi:rifampin ADP-ribosylating transferase